MGRMIPTTKFHAAPRWILVERINARGQYESYMVPRDRADWRTLAGIAVFLAMLAALAVWGG
jgi:hypothetical protein